MNIILKNQTLLLGVMWITTRKNYLALILVANEMGKIKSYMGEISGNNRDKDAAEVYEHGTKFPILVAYEAIKKSGQFFVSGDELYQNILTQNATDK